MSTFTNTLFVGKVLLRINKLDSTNNYATSLLSKNKPSEGTVISAWAQEQGKGQIGRTWLTEPGKNLTFSIIFYPRFLAAKEQFILNQAIALGVFDYVKQICPNSKVKWPNDIYVNDKKICGILIQNTLSGAHIQTAIVGIGLNVNQQNFPENLPNPTSLRLETGQTFDRDQILESVCERIETRYLQVKANNYTLIHQEYLENLYRFQEEALFEYPEGATFSGKIVGISETGKLMIDHQKGTESFDVREVRFIL